MFRFLAPSLSPTLPASQPLAPRARTRPPVVRLSARPPEAASAPPAEQEPDELAEILYRVASGGSAKSSGARSVEQSAGDAAAAPAAAEPAGPSSAAMQPSPSAATTLAADDQQVAALIAGSSVVLQLRRILQRDVGANDDNVDASTPAAQPTFGSAHAIFRSLADTDVINGPCHDGCLHPNSVWNELDRAPGTAQSIMVCFDMTGIKGSVTLAEHCCCDPPPMLGERCRCALAPLPPAHIPKHDRSHSWKGFWPFRKPKQEDEGDRECEDSRRPVVWYPSTTHLSIHAAWWGYSIYLPPPVMQELDDEHMDTVKRIAAVSTAINCILKALPSVVALTPPMLVAVSLLQGLAPIVGYIATFVSWSWQHVKSFDRGRGVILSATWAMPVALIARSWDAAYSPRCTQVPTVFPAHPSPANRALSAAASPVTSAVKAAPATPFTFTCSPLDTVESDIALAVATPST